MMGYETITHPKKSSNTDIAMRNRQENIRKQRLSSVKSTISNTLNPAIVKKLTKNKKGKKVEESDGNLNDLPRESIGALEPMAKSKSNLKLRKEYEPKSFLDEENARITQEREDDDYCENEIDDFHSASFVQAFLDHPSKKNKDNNQEKEENLHSSFSSNSLQPRSPIKLPAIKSSKHTSITPTDGDKKIQQETMKITKSRLKLSRKKKLGDDSTSRSESDSLPYQKDANDALDLFDCGGINLADEECQENQNDISAQLKGTPRSGSAPSLSQDFIMEDEYVSEVNDDFTIVKTKNKVGIHKLNSEITPKKEPKLKLIPSRSKESTEKKHEEASLKSNNHTLSVNEGIRGMKESKNSSKDVKESKISARKLTTGHLSSKELTKRSLSNGTSLADLKNEKKAALDLLKELGGPVEEEGKSFVSKLRSSIQHSNERSKNDMEALNHNKELEEGVFEVPELDISSDTSNNYLEISHEEVSANMSSRDNEDGLENMGSASKDDNETSFFS